MVGNIFVVGQGVVEEGEEDLDVEDFKFDTVVGHGAFGFWFLITRWCKLVWKLQLLLE